MFGLGTLSLPADFARLGWLPGLICLLWFAAAGTYSGLLYQVSAGAGQLQDGSAIQLQPSCQPARKACAQQLWVQLCAYCCSSVICLAGAQHLILAFNLRCCLPVCCSSALLPLQRLTLRVPRAVVFDEIGRAAMGSVGSGLVYGTIYLTILCEPIIFHLTCMETLRQVRKGCYLFGRQDGVSDSPLRKDSHMSHVAVVSAAQLTAVLTMTTNLQSSARDAAVQTGSIYHSQATMASRHGQVPFCFSYLTQPAKQFAPQAAQAAVAQMSDNR